MIFFSAQGQGLEAVYIRPWWTPLLCYIHDMIKYVSRNPISSSLNKPQIIHHPIPPHAKIPFIIKPKPNPNPNFPTPLLSPLLLSTTEVAEVSNRLIINQTPRTPTPSPRAPAPARHGHQMVDAEGDEREDYEEDDDDYGYYVVFLETHCCVRGVGYFLSSKACGCGCGWRRLGFCVWDARMEIEVQVKVVCLNGKQERDNI